MDYAQEVDSLISTLIHEGGSDLHLSALRMPVIRVNGQLISLMKHAAYTERI